MTLIFHVDDTSDAVAANFLGLLESFDLRQHVHSHTHRAGHTLDLVISRSAESILNVTSVDDSSIISDHYTVCADLQFVNPSWERKRIGARKLKAVDIEQFKQDIGLSPLLFDSSSDLQELLHLYNSELSSILDKHAPLKLRMVTIRPAAPWLSEEIKLERRIRRRLERKWRRSGLPEDRIRFIEQNRIVNQLLFSARSQYYTKLIDENCLNQRKLFGIVSKLNCCIVILHRYIPPALLRRIWRIISLASLPTKSPLFVMNLIQILRRVFIYSRKLQLQQQNSIVSPVLHIQLYLRFCVL